MATMEKGKKLSRESRIYKKCVVCNKRRIPGSNVHLIRIPLDPDRCRLWIKAIGQEELVDLPIEKLHELKFVCNAHFQPGEFNESAKRLAKHAVPTLNLPFPPLQDELFSDFPLHIGQYPSHGISEDVQRISSKKNLVPQNNEIQIVSQPEANIYLPSTSQCMVSSFSEAPVASTSREEKNTEQSYTRKSAVAAEETFRNLINIEARTSKAAQTAEKRKCDANLTISLAAPVAGTSQKEAITVQSYKRSRKSSEPKDVSSREGKLLEKLKSQKVTIRRLARSSLNLDDVDNVILKTLVDDVRKNQKKKPTGNRWSIKTKMWALAIFKRSPKAYRYLQSGISLPSIKTLQRLLQSVPLEPGINYTYLEKAKSIMSNYSCKDKICALLFDEMALKKRLMYNEASDKIEGYEDYGTERCSGIADHALVFMVQGIRKKYKFPVAFYFVKGTISSQKLYVLVKTIIKAVEEANITVITTVCDQGPTNVGAMTLLKKIGGQSSDENYFTFENKKVFILYDIPHLFKSIRNNFYNAGVLKWGNKTAKWSWLEEAEKNNKSFLNFPKITQNVVNPKYKAKMRVKYAAHALSNTMAAVLSMLSWKYVTAASEIKETAEIVKQLDQLFDICNGPSSPKDIKKGIRENVNGNTKHVEKWRQYRRIIDDIKFIKSDSHLQLNHVRCIKGFKISLKSLEDVWECVKKKGFKYLNLRQLNQDALENLFGMIRQHGVTNKNPTCSHFTAALKATIIAGLTAPHSRGSNCEPDANTFLFNYNNIKKTLNEMDITTSCDTVEQENVPVLSLPENDEDHLLEELCSFEDQPVVYVSGYLASNFIKKIDCSDCKHSLINETPQNNNMYNYIRLREWWEDKKSLTYPSVDLCQTVSQAKLLFEKFEEHYMCNLSVYCVTQFMAECNVKWLTCKIHDIREELFKKIAFLFIRKYCKIINVKFIKEEEKTNETYKKSQILSKA